MPRQGSCTVKAAVDIEPNKLVLLPCVQDLSQVTAKQATGKLMGIQAPGQSFYFNPSVKRTGQHPFLPPCWLVSRSDNADKTNVQLEECSMSTIDSIQLFNHAEVGEHAASKVRTVRLPFLTNAAPISKGEEIVLFEEKMKPVEKVKELSWMKQSKNKS